MRSLVFGSLVVLASAASDACAEATGHVEGGELLFDDPCASTTTATWTTLYQCYFGPSGLVTSCTSQAACHGGAQESGSLASGFVCGSDKSACWASMTQGGDADVFLPIVCMSNLGCAGGTTDVTNTTLFTSLHQAGVSGTLNNMPCGNPPNCTADLSSYTFSSDDIARISSWIQQGAQNN